MESDKKTDKRPRRRRRYPLGLNLRLLAFFGARWGRWVPGLIARWTFRTWVGTRRFPSEPGEAEILARASTGHLRYAGRPMAFYVWGNGPTVLLVHGWNGRGAQLGWFAAPLVDAGYRVVAFDAPGHGRTHGRRTDVAEFTGALHAMAASYGPFAAVISHSFGAVCLTHALRQGLRTKRVVCLGAPARYDALALAFTHQLGLPPSATACFQSLLQRRFGAHIWADYSPACNAPHIDLPAFIVHDKNDRAVPCRDAEAIAGAWPGARLFITRGLGHQRILRDPEVIQSVMAFVIEK